MILIAAVDQNWAIGKKGKLLVSIPADRELFRSETLGKVVVMGRRTLESLPGGQPLYGRTNVVLTHDRGYRPKGAEVFHSLAETVDFLKRFPSEDVYVIGGASVYEQFLPYCDTADLTYIDYAYEADTYFPRLDRDPGWTMTAQSEEQTYFNLCYEFRRYERRR